MITNSASPMQRRGSSNWAAQPAVGTNNVVSGGANTNGIIVRTVLLTGNGSAQLIVLAGVVNWLICPTTGYVNYFGPGVVIPAGQALEVIAQSSAAGFAAISWDPL
jgi:hypothetical protein